MIVRWKILLNAFGALLHFDLIRSPLPCIIIGRNHASDVIVRVKAVHVLAVGQAEEFARVSGLFVVLHIILRVVEEGLAAQAQRSRILRSLAQASVCIHRQLAS